MFLALGLLGFNFDYLALCWAILGRLGAVLGLSWGLLGPVLVPRGAFLGRLGVSWIIFPRLLDHFRAKSIFAQPS